MAVYRLTLNHKSDIAKLRLVKDAEEVSVIGLNHVIDSLSIQCRHKIQLIDSCCNTLILLLYLLLLTLVDPVAFIVS